MLLLPVAYFNMLPANTKYIHHCSSLHSPNLSCRKKGQQTICVFAVLLHSLHLSRWKK